MTKVLKVAYTCTNLLRSYMANKTKEETIMRLAGVRELVSYLLWRDQAISIGEAGIASLD